MLLDIQLNTESDIIPDIIMVMSVTSSVVCPLSTPKNFTCTCNYDNVPPCLYVCMHVHIPNMQDLRKDFRPKYIKTSRKSSKTSGKGQNVCGNRDKARRRDHSVYDFHLMLTYRVVIGEATLVMCFNLNPDTGGRSQVYGQALVVGTCTCVNFQ